jgi:hypothetical protein
MSDFNFAENEQINAFARELGTILRRIAGQDQSAEIEALPVPIENHASIHFFDLTTNLVEVESD